MGFVEIIAEIARRKATGDDWYVGEFPYALELVIRGAFSQVFVLPIGPESYNVKRVFRQGVTPTLGGLVAEEQGLLWRELQIAGTFALAPIKGFDTTGTTFVKGYTPDALPVGSAVALSGPGWTRRLIRNVIEHYAALKADPSTTVGTYLVWHDFKMDDHWVVIPAEMDVNRTIQRRMRYPYTLQLKSVKDADSIVIPKSKVSLLDKLRNAVAAVEKAADLVEAAVQEGTATLGEVQVFAAQVDSVLDSVTVIANSARDFTNALTDTISVGATFISSVTAAMDAINGALEAADGLPAAVRANYQRATDGLDAMAAQRGAFGTTYAQQAATQTAAETSTRDKASPEALEAARSAGPPSTSLAMDRAPLRSTDADLIEARQTASDGRIYPPYAGAKQYAVRAGDTLQSIAAAELGDGTRWFDLALINGLGPPYVTPTGGPGTVRPGDIITVPTLSADPVTAVASRGQGSEPAADLMGTDFRLVPAASSRPGRPMYDMQVDMRTRKDFRTITGFANLQQAIQLRMSTVRGTMPLVPNYGLRTLVGYGQAAADMTALRVGLRETLLADSRIAQVGRVTLEAQGDTVLVDAEVVPVGSEAAQAVSAFLGNP